LAGFVVPTTNCHAPPNFDSPRLRLEMVGPISEPARILFLDGLPIVSNLNSIRIGTEVEAQRKNDWNAEHDTI